MTELHEFTEKEILNMRRRLARQWHQKISQVTDYEAIHYLRKDRDALLKGADDE